VLFDFGRFSSVRSQKALAKAGDFQLESAGDSLVTRTSAAYFNVLVALETLSAAEASEAALKKQFDLASKRLEVGLAPITDVHDARARYDSARAATILQATALDDAYEALAEITGQRLSNLKGLSPDFRPENNEQKSIEEWVQTALDNNPAIKADAEALAAAEKDVGTARSGHYPTLSGHAAYGDDASWGSTLLRTDPSTHSEFGNASTGPSWGVTLSVPLFSGFATQSRVREALFHRDAANDLLEQEKRLVVRTTRGAYRNLLAGQAEVEARRLAVVSAQAAYEAGEAGLEVGTRPIVDVLIAQQQLYQAKTQYASSRHTYLMSILRLRQAAGILEPGDLQMVNRYLVADADAALDAVDRTDE
jgi:outer membrane protein